MQDHSIAVTPEAKLKRLTASWKLPALPSGLTPKFDFEAIKLNDKNNYYLWRNHSTRAIGTVIHRLLCQIAMEGLTHWDADVITARKPYFKILLNRQGVVAEELEPGATLVTNALLSATHDPRGRWILDNQHENAQSEYPLSTVIAAEVKHIIIDRTFIDEEGIRWIIDYKSSDYNGNDLEQFLHKETENYRPQLEEYAKIIQLSEPLRSIKLGLYFPLLKAWREWEFK